MLVKGKEDEEGLVFFVVIFVAGEQMTFLKVGCVKECGNDR